MTDTPPEEKRPDAVPSASIAQSDVRRLRLTVLAGRGPGASTSEVLRHTRGRTSLGGRPVSHEREDVAREAAAARGDADALLLHVVTDRALLDTDVATLRGRWATRPGVPDAGRILSRLSHSRRLRRTGAAVVALLALRTAWRIRRRGRHGGT